MALPNSGSSSSNGEGPCGRPLPSSHVEPVTERPRLTRRETEVLQAIADGYANREIARLLSISEPTVRTYMVRMLRRLSARTRAHAVAIGFRNELIR